MIPKEGHLRVIWRSFVTGRNRNLEKLRPIVLESWNRCRKLGVDPYQRFVTEVLPEKQLKDLQEENFSLLRVARPMMRTLFEFVAGSGFVVAVADKQGFLLEVIGNFEVLEAIQRGNFRPGARWNGISAGTNAIGTALNLDQSCQIFSYEHYCVCSHRWTCSAAPIHDPAGGLIGILDMTGSREKVHPHMLGMVVAGADAVERQLLTEKSARERDSANHIRSAIMESITDGILTVDHRQKIIHMNQAAGNILSLAPEQAEGKSVFEVLWSKERAFVEIVDGKRLVCDQELEMSTPRTSIRLIVSSQRIRGDGGSHEGTVIVFNRITRARRLVQKMSGATARHTFDDLKGKHPLFVQALELAKIASSTDSTILILGESGTGKDMIAQAMHNASKRSNGPFVAINCGAIPHSLIESELFGYVEGAFTGARKGGSPGKFELADGGTIFLDEIGDMAMQLQSTLLRVLEQKVIVRVGGTGMWPIDVRVMAATNRDLSREIEAGNFRRDLYYRLNVVSLKIPPLRERRDDILLLANHLLAKLKSFMKRPVVGVDGAAMQVLRNYSWPGNVRELQNVIERVLHLTEGPMIRIEHLPEDLKIA